MRKLRIAEWLNSLLYASSSTVRANTLEAARLQYEHHSAAREYHQAMERMLKARITRLMK